MNPDKPTIEITIRVVGSDPHAIDQILYAACQNLYAARQNRSSRPENDTKNHSGLGQMDLKIGERVIISKLDQCLKRSPLLPIDFQCCELTVKKIHDGKAYCRLPDKRGYWLNLEWLERIDPKNVTKN